jgi:hypothetical protein
MEKIQKLDNPAVQGYLTSDLNSLPKALEEKKRWQTAHADPASFNHMMFTACLPQHSQNPTRTNRSSGLIRNSYLIHKMKGSPLFWLSRSKGMTVDIWIRDYNPPRCFQKNISRRSKHNAFNDRGLLLSPKSKNL